MACRHLYLEPTRNPSGGTLTPSVRSQASEKRRKGGTMPDLKPGSIAPDFRLPTDSGGSVRLSELRGGKVVLYFYPADNTETCTIEAVDFSTRQTAFASAGAAILGISPDSAKTHDGFKAKHELSVRLASDTDLKVIRRYGLWVEKTMFGRKFMGVERATFLIGPDGRIARIWRKVRVKGHVEAALEAAKAL
jgi:peroxiredoxin Q/BCP